MKKFIAVLTLTGVVLTFGIICYLNEQRTSAASRPALESLPVETAEQSLTKAPIAPQPKPVSSAPIRKPAPVTVDKRTPTKAEPENPAAAISQAVDVLISPQVSFNDRRAWMQKLKEAGRLDQVIAELKERAASNPNDAAIPTALGVSLMNKFPVADFSEAARLGLEIDENFDSALRLNPTAWEAQYEKAHSMSYWPDGAGNKGPEIIERLLNLVQQQEATTAQPEFAKTYILLGRQLQKAGRMDEARAAWEAGLAQFPYDPTLQKALEKPANP